MKKQLFALLSSLVLLCGGYTTGIGQAADSLTVYPIPLSKSDLSGVGLKKIALENEPDRAFFQKNLFRGEDLSVYIVSSQSWPGKMDNFSIDEYVYIFNGKSRAKPVNGSDIFFQTGEHFTIPKGYTGDWEVMAGNNYHYELSVITTERAPEAKLSKKLKPALINKNTLSGLAIDLESAKTYKEEVFRGDELQIFVCAERPRTISIESPKEEQLIHILSGQLELKDSTGDVHSFYTGDFFILPKGFTGEWKSEGHGVLKYLSIRKVKE